MDIKDRQAKLISELAQTCCLGDMISTAIGRANGCSWELKSKAEIISEAISWADDLMKNWPKEEIPESYCHVCASRERAANWLGMDRAASPEKGHKRYLGDGVYASLDGTDLILTTENGIAVRNRIVIEAEILQNLFEYLQLDVKRRPSTFEKADET